MTRIRPTPVWNATDGALPRYDALRFVARAIAARIASLPTQLRQHHGIADASLGRLDPDAIALPDTVAARHASEHAQALSEPWLFQHCLRTYVWAALLAQSDSLRFDRELLFVACALHDLGLTDAHTGHAPGCACFAIEGAHAAHTFAERTLGWQRERCDRLADAIAMHLNVRVAAMGRPEAHLLNAGAALDVVGLRMREIPSVTRIAVFAAYPRHDFVPRLASAMKAQARMRPRSRAALLVRLGFCGMIRANPLHLAARNDDISTAQPH